GGGGRGRGAGAHAGRPPPRGRRRQRRSRSGSPAASGHAPAALGYRRKASLSCLHGTPPPGRDTRDRDQYGWPGAPCGPPCGAPWGGAMCCMPSGPAGGLNDESVANTIVPSEEEEIETRSPALRFSSELRAPLSSPVAPDGMSIVGVA